MVVDNVEPFARIFDMAALNNGKPVCWVTREGQKDFQAVDRHIRMIIVSFQGSCPAKRRYASMQ
jgi:hypothetical protein